MAPQIPAKKGELAKDGMVRQCRTKKSWEQSARSKRLESLLRQSTDSERL